MAEDLRPDESALEHHLDLLSRWAPDAFKDARWEWGAGFRIHELHVMHGYVGGTDEGTIIAYVHEDYDEIDVKFTAPFMHPSAAPADSLASV